MTLPAPPQPFQRPMLNGPDVGVYSHRDIHAERGVTFWPVAPPTLSPLSLAISGHAPPARWIVHYDNLMYGASPWKQHASGSTPSRVHYGIVYEHGASPRLALTAYLRREMVVYSGTTQRGIATFAELTQVLAIQPVGIPYLRLLLPATLFLTRDAQTGRQCLILPPTTHPVPPPTTPSAAP